MTDQRIYKGSCFCGTVELVVEGEPEAMGFCHCTSCRRWSAAPINAFTLWKPEAVKVTKGVDLVDTYHKTIHSYRSWCTLCGGHLYTEHPGLGVTDVYAAVLHEFPFEAKLHVHAGEAVLALHDGLATYKDLPAELGGSGVLLSQRRASARRL